MLRRFGLFETDMPRTRPRFFRTAEGVSLASLCAAFTIWLSLVILSGGLLGCVAIFILWTIDATTGWRFRIAPRLSTATRSDRLAWITFSIGVWTMLWIVLMAVRGDGDGDHRTSDEIRRQVRMLLAAGVIAAAVPAIVTSWQLLNRRRFKGNLQGEGDLRTAENDSPTAI